MDVVTTSLEALIQRAINSQNQKIDNAAMDAFCVMVVKEAGGMQIGCKLLATHIQSSTENEALQALILLDTCMRRCGRLFHSEVGKFRFLNEMIKLVSPKYLGDKTPQPVREKVLELLQNWTHDYPRETKIKEAFEMLKNQGVVKDSTAAHVDKTQLKSQSPKVKNALFEDEETAKLLQELLQSKDPFELQLANKLIKSMVKDDERRIQQKSQRNLELESVHNNVKLLSEMLDSYNPADPNPEDVELMKELHQTCERLKPTLLRLAEETQDGDDVLNNVLTANDELSQVFEKFSSTFSTNQPESNANGTSLLDLDCPLDTNPSVSNIHLLNDNQKIQNSGPSDIEMLGDIFNSIGMNLDPISTCKVNNFENLMSNANVLQPIAVTKTKGEPEITTLVNKFEGKAKALEDLNEMGKIMLQESLLNNKKKTKNLADDLGGSVSISAENTNGTAESEGSENDSNKNTEQLKNKISDDKGIQKKNGQVDEVNVNWVDRVGDNNKNGGEDKKAEVEIKPLGELHVSLSDIKPSQIPPMTVIDNKNGISVILHFADGGPRDDVTVIVVTTVSKNSKALSNYLFQAVVPKTCKCRLQQPSGVDLPGHNPFLPPAAITQIMLIANPQKMALSLKFMLSYTMEDETFTEMGEVDNISTS